MNIFRRTFLSACAALAALPLVGLARRPKPQPESWLTPEEAIRMAFKNRSRSKAHGDPWYTGPRNPILITDFDPHNLRVMEVVVGDWDDWHTWTVSDRPMSKHEYAYLNWWRFCPGACRIIGDIIPCGDRLGKIYRTHAYIKRPGAFSGDWTICLDVDQVNGTVNYSHEEGRK